MREPTPNPDCPAPRHHLTISGWHPARVNTLLGSWQRRHRLKKADQQMVGTYARLAGIPPATMPRRVSHTIILGPGERAGDPDSYFKSVLDALTACGLLVDDNRQGVELGQVVFERGPELQTVIELEDLE
jgi:hypothetical protein